MTHVTNSSIIISGAKYPLTRKPLGIWKALKLNWYHTFRPSKLVFVGISKCEVLRMPDGTYVAIPVVSRNAAGGGESIPFPPSHLIVYQSPYTIGPVLSREDTQADNMPNECSPEAKDEDDFVSKLTKEAADLEDAASPSIPSIEKE